MSSNNLEKPTQPQKRVVSLKLKKNFQVVDDESKISVELMDELIDRICEKEMSTSLKRSNSKIYGGGSNRVGGDPQTPKNLQTPRNLRKGPSKTQQSHSAHSLRKPYLTKLITSLREESLLTEEAILSSFKLYDTDGSETISRGEIRQIVRLAGEGEMGDNEIEEIVRESDIDGDGEIDFKEFAKVIVG